MDKNNKRIVFGKFIDLIFLKIFATISVNKEGVQLPLKVEH